MDLTDEDVRAILLLLETSGFGNLELETPDFRLTLHRTQDGGWTRESTTSRPARTLKAAAGDPAEVPAAPGSASAGADEARTELLDVRTPLPGTFYRSPKPGAPPFVEVGHPVGEHTVIGIVETMKLMNSVYAGAAGRIAEICLADATAVGQDAVLMRIEPDRS